MPGLFALGQAQQAPLFDVPQARQEEEVDGAHGQGPRQTARRLCRQAQTPLAQEIQQGGLATHRPAQGLRGGRD